MIEDLIVCCYEQLSLGQLDMKQLGDRLGSLSEAERKSVCYHTECRKPIVNKSMIEKLRGKRTRRDSPARSSRGPG